MQLLHTLGSKAAAPGHSNVICAGFIGGALHELSVGLCRGNHAMTEPALVCWLKPLGNHSVQKGS
jgi:hypothetical protein